MVTCMGIYCRAWLGGSYTHTRTLYPHLAYTPALSILDDSMVVKCSEHLATSCLSHLVPIPPLQELKSWETNDCVSGVNQVGAQDHTAGGTLRGGCQHRSTKGRVLGWQPGAVHW